MYICIRYHFVANVPITEIGSIQVFSKQMKIKENTAKIVGANFLDVLWFQDVVNSCFQNEKTSVHAGHHSPKAGSVH